MTTVGAQTAYALELNPQGHLSAAFFGGVRVPVGENASESFTVYEQYPAFHWGHKIEQDMAAGARYHARMKSDTLRREVAVWKDEEGMFFVLVAVPECDGVVEFTYQISGTEQPTEFRTIDELGREWSIRLNADPRLFKGGVVTVSGTTAYVLSFSLRHPPLTAIVTGDVEEAAVLSSVLGHERYAVAVIPPDDGDIPAREFSNSPMFRALAKLNSSTLVTSLDLAGLGQRFESRVSSTEEVLRRAEGLPELRTPRRTLAEAVLLARASKSRVVIDESAPAVQAPEKARMIFYEGDGLSAVVAANLAFDLSAGLKRLPVPGRELRLRWEKILAEVRADRGPKRLPLWTRVRLRLRVLKNFLRGTRGELMPEYYQSNKDELIETLSAEVRNFYGETVGGAREACAFLDSVDLPLTIGFDLPVGHIPNVIAPYFTARELAWMRGVHLQPFTAAICDPGVAGTTTTEAISEVVAEISANNWFVYSYGAEECDLDLILRYQLADFIYLITHAGPGAHNDRGMVEHSGERPFLGREMAEIRFPGEPLMFNNACASWPGFGSAVLRAGACSYVGTLWPVFADLAGPIGSAFKRRMIQGDSWARCLQTALADMPRAERSAYFVVGTGFRNFSAAPHKLSAVELAVQGSGLHLYEEVWDLAAFRTSPEQSVIPIMWLTWRAASRKELLPADWQWLALAQYISVAASVPLIDGWRMFRPMVMVGLASLRSIYEGQEWNETPGQMSSRSALREALYDLHYVVSSAAFQFDDWEAAREVEETILAKCTDWGHEDALPTVKNNLAKIYTHLGKPELAEPLLQQSISEKEAAGSADRLNDSLLTLSISLQKRGEHEKALPILDGLINAWSVPEGFENITSTSAQKKLCIALANRAGSLIALGRSQAALADLQQALAGFRILGMFTDAFKTHIQLALAYFMCGQVEEAREHIAQARSFSTDLLQLAPESRREVERLAEAIAAQSDATPAGGAAGVPRSGAAPPNLPNLPAPPPAAIREANANIEALKARVAGAEKPGSLACVVGLHYFRLADAEQALPWFKIWEGEGYPEPSEPDADWKSCAIAFEYVVRTLGDAGEVEQTFQRLLERSPECSELNTELGTWLLLENRLDEAEPHLKRGRELDPNDTQALCCLGEIEERRGNRKAAINLYGEALQTRPDPWTYNKLGLLLQDEGYTDAAVAHFNRAALLGMTDAYWNLAQIEEQRGFATGVKINLEKYLAGEPRDVAGWLWLSGTLFKDGNFDASAHAAGNALILDWTTPRSLFVWLVAEGIRSGQPSESISEEELEYCGHALANDTIDLDARRHLIEVLQQSTLTYVKSLLLAILHEQDGRSDLALPLLDTILQKSPQDYLANMLMHQFLLKVGDKNRAASTLHTILANQQAYHSYFRRLARSFQAP